MTDDKQSAYLQENRRYWNSVADWWAPRGEAAWQRREPVWGIWGVPESEVQLLPTSMQGLNAVELGCGTGYVGAWMARRGAVVTGIDLSERQLETARRLEEDHGLGVTFVHGNAEATPFADASFDFAISEYGAALWCDPQRWLREASRILKPDGRLVFWTQHPFAYVTAPQDGSLSTERLERPYFGLRMMDWTAAAEDPGGMEFTLPLSGWFEALTSAGFVVERLLEPQAPSTGPDEAFFVSRRWAQAYPSELAFVAHKRG